MLDRVQYSTLNFFERISKDNSNNNNIYIYIYINIKKKGPALYCFRFNSYIRRVEGEILSTSKN
jgi:hypothetical protein